MSDVQPPLPPPTLLERLNARIEHRSTSRHRTMVLPDRESYRRAAAVLASLELPTLKPFSRSGRTIQASPLVLLPDVTPVSGQSGERLVTLKGSVRRETLERLGPDYFPAALAANPQRPETPLQRAIEAWIRGELPDLAHASYAELTDWVQVASWFEGILPGRPRLADLQRLLNRRSVYAKFEHLAAREFVGRESELSVLREYVGVLEPGSTSAAVSRQLRHWLGLEERAPLIVEGVGGIGKSALIGRFLVEHAAVPPELRFPFAYLAFDNPLLHVTEPVTIAKEMARQLQLLSPEYEPALRGFSEQLHGYDRDRRHLDEKAQQLHAPGREIDFQKGIDFLKGSDLRKDTPSGASTRFERTMLLRSADVQLFKAFADGVRQICSREGASVPFVLVLDTFEEALYGGWERLLGLIEFLRLVQKTVPSVRVVLSMRPPFTVPDAFLPTAPAKLRVSALSYDASVMLLRRLGIEDEATAVQVARQIGGNPLNLRLAARLVEHEHVSGGGVRGIRTRSWLVFSISDEIVRGQLYTRILSHIHDEDVRMLAHPGMVLRRVTPEMIVEVLAEPCHVKVAGPEHARQLFNELAGEHTLVERDVDGELRYRADIREPSLTLLQQDRPAQVRKIHEAAVRFYERQADTPENRAEELYHRLALDEEPATLESRWTDTAAPSLAPAVSELPARAQAWLASRLGFDLPPEIRKRASIEDWERVVGRKIRDLLRYLQPEQALELLDERSERSRTSPLFALESKALVLLGRYDAAAAVLERGIDSLKEGQNRGRLAELLWLRAQLFERARQFVEADRMLQRAEQVARNIQDPLCRLQILVQRLLLARASGRPDGSGAVRESLAALMSALSDDQMMSDRSLVRAAMMVLGPDHRGPFLAGLQAVGVPEPGPEQQVRLAFALRDLAADPASQATLARCADNLENLRVGFKHVLPTLLGVPMAHAVVLPMVQALLEAASYSLSAANLAGIDDYREPWELESPSEAA